MNRNELPSFQIIPLLKAIKSPFILSADETNLVYSREHYLLACKNKIPLTYLKALRSDQRQRLSEYTHYYNRFFRKLGIVAEISKVFEERGIDYIVFQTLHDDPADIDILNIGGSEQFHEMFRILLETGYITLGKVLHGAHLFDKKYKIVIHLKNEISVSHLIYVNKYEIKDYVKTVKLFRNIPIKVFAPEVELLVNIAHSVLDKNVYRLSEYNCALNCFEKMSEKSIKRLAFLIKHNYFKNAARWYLTLTLLLHIMAYGIAPKKISQLLDMIGPPCSSAYKLVDSTKPPFKISFIILVKAFEEKFNDKCFRRSIPAQIPHTFNHNFVWRFLRPYYRECYVKNNA